MRKIPKSKKLYASMITKQKKQREDANTHHPACKKPAMTKAECFRVLGF